MEKRTLGTLGPVSRLTLGGGGIGAVWGEVSREEGVATLRAALDAGITMIDAAPGYLACEQLIGEAFDGRLPDGTLLTTKCGLGDFERGTAATTLRASLEASLATMRVDHVDVFFLHNHLRPHPPVAPGDQRDDVHWHTPLTAFTEEVVPAMEAIVADGLAASWGITAVDVPGAVIAALEASPGPAVIQAVTNLLDSPGGLNAVRATARPRDIIAAAGAAGVGVMGIRAVQAGALTEGFDREVPADHLDAVDHDRAAPFRRLCREWGQDPAVVAHRYALGMEGVDTLVLGVKNRRELEQIVAAEAEGPLAPSEMAEIDGLGLR